MKYVSVSSPSPNPSHQGRGIKRFQAIPLPWWEGLGEGEARNDTGHLLAFILLLVFLFVPLSVSADIVYPARLEMKEREPGLFEVTFNLPIISGKRLKAKPAFPPVCEEIAEAQIQQTMAGYAETRQLRCDSDALYGQQILIYGLLGTQTDVLFFLETLDGRKYTSTLKPAKAVFTVPSPPSLLELGRQVVLDGMRRMLRRPELWLVLFVALFLGFSRISLGTGIIVYAVAYAVSQALATQNWLTLFPSLPPVIAALTVFIPSFDMAKGQQTVRGWIAPFWLSMLFLGLLYGGSSSKMLSPDGLSHYEQQLALAVFTLGIGGGLLLIVLCMSEFRRFIPSLFSVAEDQATRRAGYLGGIAAWGLCLYYGSAFLVYTPEVFTFAFIPLLLAFLLGVQLPSLIRGNPRWMLPLFSVIFSIGLLAGFRGIPFPMTTFIVFGSLFFFGFLSLVQRTIPSFVLIPMTTLAIVYHGWYLGNSIGENIALAIPNTVGAALLVTFVLYIGISLFEGTRSRAALRGIQILAGGIVLLALVLRLKEYSAWIGEQIIPEMALGILSLPLLTLAAIVLLIFNWPQKPKFRANVDQPDSSPIFHWALLGMTFFLLPYGIIRIHNPFFDPHPPSADNAKKIVSVLLSNTYKAFNLDEEDVVYDRLSENVTDDLIVDIYLDSRRRLEAGTLEGAKVTVKDVRVLAMSEAAGGKMQEEGFLYACQWSVTANVRHWKHTHNRQNIYNAILTLKVVDETWKISHIELLSEERVIMRT